jgi:lipid II:glycine glycyltransferase (peptidoglycan interpeptide bridge formation enzyme)
MLYIPKGPLFGGGINSGKIILEHIKEFAQERKAIYIKIDPDTVVGTGIEGLDANPDNEGVAFRNYIQATGWRYSPDQVQFKNTIRLDLVPNIDVMLASMKPKTRYNIRLAEKKGVKIRPGTMKDLALLYRMYAETALRDHFILRHEQYYMFTWELFMQKQMAEPLIAEVEGVPVAAVFMIRFAGKAWYVYGMSKQIHREKMPNHLLQWQAILRAKEVGCTCYDFWGAPSVFKESDPLWGVFKFKEGFGGKVVRTVGAWDFALRPTLYRTTTILLPKILDLLRRNARKQLSAASQL